MNKAFEEEIIAHAEEAPDQEVCGFIVLNQDLSVGVCPEKNENPNPSGCFSISPAKFLYYKLNKNVLGVYHSHPITTERPSKQDKLISEEMGMPYLIYSLKSKKFNLYYPESYEPAPLTGRPYIKGFYECSCLLKDYFKDNLDLNISKWNTNYWLPQKDKKANDLLLKILKKNTIEVKDKKIEKHDIIVFEIKDGGRLHVGLYCNTDMFLHQPIPTLSGTELLDSRWQNKIKGVYRHPSLV
jgi:proteasome lid subunit RPN8/RPN11